MRNKLTPLLFRSAVPAPSLPAVFACQVAAALLAVAGCSSEPKPSESGGLSAEAKFDLKERAFPEALDAFPSSKIMAITWSSAGRPLAHASDGAVLALDEAADKDKSKALLVKGIAEAKMRVCAESGVCWEFRDTGIARIEGKSESVFPLKSAAKTALAAAAGDRRLLVIDALSLVVASPAGVTRLRYTATGWGLDTYALPPVLEPFSTLIGSLEGTAIRTVKGSSALSWTLDKGALTLNTEGGLASVQGLGSNLDVRVWPAFSWKFDSKAGKMTVSRFYGLSKAGKMLVASEANTSDVKVKAGGSGVTFIPSGGAKASAWPEVLAIATASCLPCHAPGTAFWADATKEESWSGENKAKIKARLSSTGGDVMPPKGTPQDTNLTAAKRASLLSYLDGSSTAQATGTGAGGTTPVGTGTTPVGTGTTPGGAAGAWTLFRAIDVGGDTSGDADGFTWVSENTARSMGFFLAGGTSITGDANWQVANPPADDTLKAILRNGAWESDANSSDLGFTQMVPAGRYRVTLYAHESYMDNVRKYDLKLNGTIVASDIGDIPKWDWKKYGPYEVDASGGSIEGVLVGKSAKPLLSGLVIERSGP